MSKSNKEKERLKRIKLFEKGEISFDASMLKLKLDFFEVELHVSHQENVKKLKIFVDRQHKTIFKKLISDLICNHLSNIKIYDFKIKIDMNISPLAYIENPEKYVYFRILLFCKKQFLCEFESNNNNRSYLKTYKLDEKIIPNDILSDFSLNFKNAYKTFSISNDSISKLSVKNTVFNNKKFKNFLFYKNVNFFMKYIKNHNSIFKINQYNISYNFLKNTFDEIMISDDRNNYYGDNIAVSPTGMSVLNLLREVKFINFDIKDLSEEEFFEMYELLNY